MGGTNESILKSDKKEDKKESVLSPDLTPTPVEKAEVVVRPVVSSETLDLEVFKESNSVFVQTQVIRQHMSNGQIHLHAEDVDKKPLKAAIPVAEWFVIMRNLQTLNAFTFIDKENKCVAYLRPYIHNDLFEISVELKPIELGPRFISMNTVTKR